MRLISLLKTETVFHVIFLGFFVILLSSKGMLDESTIALNGDMPKFLMNGVYFYDLMADLPIDNLVEHAYRYFARYPALSIGHHPILPGVAAVPFYAITGISVFSARLMTLFFMLLAAFSFYFLVRDIYDNKVAIVASFLLVSTPFVVNLSHLVMSEIPALSLLILTIYLFYHYCEFSQKSYAIAMAISLSLSLYAKHHTVFLVPVFLAYFLVKKGPRELLKKELLYAYGVAFVLTLPLVFITLKFSQTNISWVMNKPMSARFSSSNFLFYPATLWKHHLTWPVFILSLVSLAIFSIKRDGRLMLFVFWVLGLYGLLALLGVQQHPRYALYWIPPFCLFAATSIHYFKPKTWKVFISTVLLVVGGYQFVVAYQEEPDSVAGYEEAAKHVVQHRVGRSVLYSGVKDTGYFTFFVRKFDSERDLIVLRADKVLATSRMSQIVEDRVTDSDSLYNILNDFGVGYVVIENTEVRSKALLLLRKEVQSEKFILRKEIVIRSNRPRLQGMTLSLYEYREHRPPKAGVMLQMGIPLMGDSMTIPFDDLLQKQ